MTTPDVNAAAHFLANSGRVLDRRRFERLFLGGSAQAVRDAVAAYRNPDGGLGWGLEPDGRTPASQPLAIEHGLRVLHEADAWDEELVAGTLRWLEANTPEEGGATGVAPTAAGWPHAPWWDGADGSASVITTGQIAGILHARRVQHPWLERATELLWSRIDRLPEVIDVGSLGAPYEMRGALRFLQRVPDRERAERAFGPLGRLLADSRLVVLDPDRPGEVLGPLDYAPDPDSLARRVFEPAVIEAHLEHLGRGQQPDGGWTFNWPVWSAAAEMDWRGSVTVDALLVLRTNGRLLASRPAAGAGRA